MKRYRLFSKRGCMGYPACFQSQDQYDGWKALARLAREMASICTDCSTEYRDRMLEERRCFASKWSKIVYKSTQELTLETALAHIPPINPKKASQHKRNHITKEGTFGGTPRSWIGLLDEQSDSHQQIGKPNARKKADKGKQGLD
jgi:hypothetical protein